MDALISVVLDAALMVIRAKGYTATTVDDLCAASDVTKGAFFHHFKSKNDLAIAAADYWSEMTDRLFAAAPYHTYPDPLDRVLGYIDFRKTILTGTVPEFTASWARWCRKPTAASRRSAMLARARSAVMPRRSKRIYPLQSKHTASRRDGPLAVWLCTLKQCCKVLSSLRKPPNRPQKKS